MAKNDGVPEENPPKHTREPTNPEAPELFRSVTYVEILYAVLQRSILLQKNSAIKKNIPKKAVFLPKKTVLIFCLLFVCLPSKIMHEKNGGHRASFPTTRGDWLLWRELCTRMTP